MNIFKSVIQIIFCFIAAFTLFSIVVFFIPSLLSKEVIPPEKICTYDYPCYEQS